MPKPARKGTPAARAFERVRALPADHRRAVAVAARERLAILSLADFVRLAWPVIEPIRLAWNWHFDVICAELEAVNAAYDRGEPTELVICIPPGHAKSLLVSVFWPAWTWLRNPERRVMCLANADDLVKRDSRRTRDLILSAFYQALKRRAALPHPQGFGVRDFVDPETGETSESWSFKRDQNAVINYANTAGGFRQCLAIGATVTGKRADGQIIDDPVDAKAVVLGSTGQIAHRMLEVRDTYDAVLSSRLNDQRRAFRVLIMQRLHPADLAGVLIDRGARAVTLPTEYDPTIAHPLDPRGGYTAPATPPSVEGEAPAPVVGANTPTGPRAEYERRFGRRYSGPTGAGALLFPAMYPADVVARIKRRLGPRHYSAQEQQRPTATTGSIFRQPMIRYYAGDPQRLPVDEQAISVDCSFRKNDDTDYVVLQVWGRRGADRYLLDQVRSRMTYTETRAALIAIRARWSRVRLILIEAKANGDALIDDLKSVIPGIVGFDPGNASKDVRASLAAVDFEAGNVYLPDPRFCPWITDYVRELLEFPGSLNDDQVDATAQIILRWSATALADVSREFGFLFRAA